MMPMIRARRMLGYKSLDWRGDQWLQTLPFLAMHVAAAVGIYCAPPTRHLLELACFAYVARTFAITGGYHRYFSHRGFKTSRTFQFILALAGTLAMQKGPLWWAAQHRKHHRFSDTEKDPHSPRVYGFFRAYAGWILDRENESTDLSLVSDFAAYPELVLLNRYYLVPPILAGIAIYLIWGRDVFIWTVLVSTVIQWHEMFSSNTFCHIFGTRRFEIQDDSRNNALFGVLTLGEGWHNNHHYYASSARQGFYWWEIDITYYILWLLKQCHIVWAVRDVPEKVFVAAAARKSPIGQP